MSSNRIALGLATVMAVLGSAGPAAATDGREPASLLLFCEFDNRFANLTLATITNTNCDFTPSTDNPNLYAGTTDVEIIYIGKTDTAGNPIPCTETNRQVRLSPCDTFTFITSAHNPQFEQGFFYAFAKNPVTGAPWSFNYLVGSLARINGIEDVEYSMNAVSFKSPIAERSITNLDGDSLRDLNGAEYSTAPEEILIPRFLATKGQAQYHSELLLLGLSGGAVFTTVAELSVYNDNEEKFSTQRIFVCWDRVKLIRISGVFSNVFLQSTNHAPNEILGSTFQEAGWIKVDASFAYSTVEQISDPAIYAVVVEKTVAGEGASDLPWELGENVKGDLYPHTLLGDGGLDGN